MAATLRPSTTVSLEREAQCRRSDSCLACEDGHLSHRGSDDTTPADRVARAGYAWKAVGENVAAGPDTAKKVVDGWLSSPAHCENVMDPDFSEMGIAYFTNPKRKVGIYWAQVFARPRQPKTG